MIRPSNALRSWGLAAAAIFTVAAATMSLFVKPSPSRPVTPQRTAQASDLSGGPRTEEPVTSPEKKAPSANSAIVVTVKSSSKTVDPSQVTVIVRRGQDQIAETARDGPRWEYRRIAPGDYDMLVDDGSGPLAMTTVKVGTSVTEVELDLRGRSKVTVLANVTTLGDGPLTVVLTPKPHGEKTAIQLDNNGKAAFDLPRGSYRADLNSGSEVVASDEWIVTKPRELREFPLIPSRFRVLVIGTDGKPHPGCRVEYELSHADTASAATDSDQTGQLVALLVPGSLYRFRLTSNTCGSLVIEDTLAPTHTDRITLAYQGTGKVALTLRDGDGAPVVGGVLEFCGPGGLRRTVTTGKNGTAGLSTLAGGWYTAGWRHPEIGLIRGFADDILVAPGECTTLSATVDLPDCGVVSGQVTWNGKGARGVRVQGAGPFGYASVVSGAGGTFTLRRLYGNPVRVWVDANPEAGIAYSYIQTELNSRDVVLKLNAGCRLEVVVSEPGLDDRERGPTWAWFRLPDTGKVTPVGLRRVSGTKDRFYTDLVPVTASEIRIGGGGFLQTDWFPMKLRREVPNELEIKLIRSQRVECEFGSPFAGIAVLYGRSGGKWHEADRAKVRNATTVNTFFKSALSADEYCVIARSVDGTERFGRAPAIRGEPKINISVRDVGGARIVVKASSEGIRTASLFRESMADAGPVGVGAVQRLVGVCPSKWRSEQLRMEVSPKQAAVFGGLLPGRYRVVIDGDSPTSETTCQLSAGESVTVVLE